MKEKQRTAWTTEELTLIEDAMSDLGANDDCAKFLIESLVPSISPRMILNAARLITQTKGIAKSRWNPSFEEYLNEAHAKWNRNKYYAQAVIGGEPYIGITVVRKRLSDTFSRDELMRAGLSIPLPKARRLDDWIRRRAGVKSRMLNGARLYPQKDIFAYVESRTIDAKAEPAKAEPAKAEPAKAEPAKAEPASVVAAPSQQMSLPEMLAADPNPVSTPDEDEDALIRRAAKSKHRKLTAAAQLAEVDEQMTRAAHVKALEAHRAAGKALAAFEEQMAEYLSQ